MKTKIKVRKTHFMTVKRKAIKMNIIQQDLTKITLLQPYNKTTFLVFLQDKTEKMRETILHAAEKQPNKSCKKLFL